MSTCDSRNLRSGNECHKEEGHDGAHIHFGTHFTEAWGWTTPTEGNRE